MYVRTYMCTKHKIIILTLELITIKRSLVEFKIPGTAINRFPTTVLGPFLTMCKSIQPFFKLVLTYVACPSNIQNGQNEVDHLCVNLAIITVYPLI